jgi:hypothetical protein
VELLGAPFDGAGRGRRWFEKVDQMPRQPATHALVWLDGPCSLPPFPRPTVAPTQLNTQPPSPQSTTKPYPHHPPRHLHILLQHKVKGREERVLEAPQVGGVGGDAVADEGGHGLRCWFG